MESMDGLALIGRSERNRNVFIATGDCGNGMTHGTIAGILLPDLIAGRTNAWAEVYDPRRLRLRALGRFARENLNVAARYADWLALASAPTERIPPGSGAVVRRGLTPVAVYRDHEGRVHERSAVCPHLGCVVAWNGEAGTWDCPCHGSRFTATGELTHGPATRDLAGSDEDGQRDRDVPPRNAEPPSPSTGDLAEEDDARPR
jgi:nitrite reductase/ring-hydroxylating ferredoxin subunit